MAPDPITTLLIVREWHAQERRDLLSDFCDHDVVTGQPIVATLDPLMQDAVDAEERLLAMIDETLIARGVDPDPQIDGSSKVINLNARRVMKVRAAVSDGWTGDAA